MNIALGIGQALLKSIPYPAQVHNDGTNHGFVVLKGNRTDVAEVIEEAKKDLQLAGALREINREGSPLFSIGCDNLHIFDGIRGRGYVIAYNTLEEARDSASYFRMFESFTEFVRASNSILRLQYWFEIQRSRFENHGVEGFTLQIWLMIGPVSTKEEAEYIWRTGLNVLERFATTLPGSASGTPIF
jgi:hypothetical protein